jgi:hypothetical protein
MKYEPFYLAPLTVLCFAAFLLSGIGCGRKEETEPNSGLSVISLSEKATFYASLLTHVADSDGFIEVDRCDSVHFTALTAAATVPVNIRAAIDSSGKLHRRPSAYPECYPEFSKSENSRDAFLMVLLYGLQHRDLDLLDGIFRYGRKHLWVMGEGYLSRTLFTPNMQALYAQAISALGGESYWEQIYPIEWSKSEEGFAAHLQVLSVLAYGKIHGGITDGGLEVLSSYAQKQPRNPLFTASYYRYSNDQAFAEMASASLLDESLWPANRLPESKDRCEPWLPQRSEGDSWLPCPEEGRTHSGGDLLMSEAILSGRF